MAKQLDLLNSGNIIPTPIHGEMQRSYLEYAMSVIVGRALPDVRDGLKPVHRRILYAMHELGLTPDRPYRKCARVVGDVLGKYHPHGDQAVYDALVRLVQDFSSRYPLLGGHGNFGSVDNDPPAAMRYTETRLAPIAHEALLQEIGEATVGFIGNFDNSQQEPVVLPAQLPILLLNGCAGIAVGMATNIPPHNLGEIVDGLIALIDRPDLPDSQLWQLIPAPDFPTGGAITDTTGIRDAYSTGKGSIPVQGITNIETIEGSRGKRRREAIIVTELPYQVNKAGWIEKVAELVNAGKIEGIADLRDESDRQGMRVVIELKRDTDPQKVLRDLHRQTALATNFGVIMLALVNGQPRQLTLRQTLTEFLSFREDTLRRQYRHELEQAERRRHLVEGLLTALGELDTVIEILRHAADGSTAKLTLESRLGLSDRQAEAILAMPLRRLTGMERQNLQQEFQEISDRITHLRRLLDQRHELLKALKKDLRSLKKKFADPRRTRLPVSPSVSASDPVASSSTGEITNQTATPTAPIEENLLFTDPIPTTPKTPKATRTPKVKDANQISLEPELTTPAAVVLEFTHHGYIQRQKSNVKSSPPSLAPITPKAGEGVVIRSIPTHTLATLILITALGKAYGIKVQDIPPAAGLQSGKSLNSLLPKAAQGHGDEVIEQFLLPETPRLDELILLTQQGFLKRLPLEVLQDLTSRGLGLLKLKEGDRLQFVCPIISPAEVITNPPNLIVATSSGRLLRWEVSDRHLPITGRSTQGLLITKFRPQEKLVGLVALTPQEQIILVTKSGYSKRLPINLMRLVGKGELGTQGIQFPTKQDTLAGIATTQTPIALKTSLDRLLWIAPEQITLTGKDGAGDRLSQLTEEEEILAVW
ncbi:MAG: DNA topoisomerase 4 subunit A [Coleofasciculaceae cyanobacterium SM2_1_6]|nr:DNA topoisomerase 4 subunit A [Coleofasciculaceae cyanobacterium SM2_1_6]